jgi:hypothetical protein
MILNGSRHPMAILRLKNVERTSGEDIGDIFNVR